MIESAIASSHHFYMVFFQAPQIRTLQSLINLFEGNKDHQKVNIPKPIGGSFIHLQIEIDALYGSENMLLANQARLKGGKKFYWYDFYLGKTEIDNVTYFFICYPYNKLGKYIDQRFVTNKIKRTFYKPKVSRVLDYMKKRGESKLSDVELEGFDIDIIKYSAEVKEEANANRINIIGANPLNSRIFDILNRDKQIVIEPISLKLKCGKTEMGSFDLSFDRLGNYRFWLKRDLQNEVIPILPFSIRFFHDIDSLEESSFISNYTFLEDE